MRTRWIYAPDPQGWSDFAMAERELTAAGWTDCHPHTETNLRGEHRGRHILENLTACVKLGQ